MTTTEALAELFEQPPGVHCERCGHPQRPGDDGEVVTIWRRRFHSPAERIEHWQCGPCCFAAALARRQYRFNNPLERQ